MTDPVNGNIAAEEELVDYEEEEVAAEGDAKAEQVRSVLLCVASFFFSFFEMNLRLDPSRKRASFYLLIAWLLYSIKIFDILFL